MSAPALLCGSDRQIKWATTIRRDALKAIAWDSDQVELLARIVDSTWWIANRGTLLRGSYRDPSPDQIIGEKPAVMEAEPGTEPTAKVAREAALRSADERLSDAELWANSVSQNPILAQAAILAVLSRQYKEPMKSKLKKAVEERLALADHSKSKDVHAIRRMIE